MSCAATDGQGRKYELQFVSDGAPMTLRKFRQAPLPNETRRANQIAQLECRLGAEAAKILPRDRTAYIIKCLADDGQKPGRASVRRNCVRGHGEAIVVRACLNPDISSMHGFPVLLPKRDS